LRRFEDHAAAQPDNGAHPVQWPGTHNMRSFCTFLLFTSTCLFAQAPTVENAKPAAAAVKPDTVVVTINGKPYTAADVDTIVKSLPQTQRAAYQKDPKTFLQQYAEMQAILHDAEKQNLGEKVPYKDQLAELERQTQFYHKQILLQAAVNERTSSIPVTTDQMKALYDKNPDKYREAKVKLIYIPFTAGSALAVGRTTLTEAEAKAKAESLVSEARKGGDFVKLVKENSQDKDSVARDGDFGMPIRATTDRVPPEVKRAVLNAKAGDVTDPIRGNNGFYIFKVESVGVAPFDSLQKDLWKEVQAEGVSKWLATLRSENTVKVENEDYFKK
jgi:peptidyl-prolyl cis-trans isomerase C